MSRAMLALRFTVVAILLSAVAVACAAPADAPAVAEGQSNLDTSGCSGGIDSAHASGPVDVVASRPPKESCWNIPSSGLTLSYSWLQANEAKPQKNDIGFWTSLNGAGTYAKASAYRCNEVMGGGLGHDTSADRSYRCTATRTFDFASTPALLREAYGADGMRAAWQVQVAVSLDDEGAWDSLGGANYRFAF
jgi:hypothetical protein